MRQGGIWAAGLAGSVLAHLALAAVLLIALRPGPVTDQPMPQSEIDVQAHQVPRQSAEERQPRAEDAARGDASGTGLAAGAIPRDRAAAQRPAAQAVTDTQPAAQAVAEARDQSAELTAARPRPVAARPARPPAAPLPQVVPAVARAQVTAPPRAAAMSEAIPAVARSGPVPLPTDPATTLPAAADVLPQAAATVTAAVERREPPPPLPAAAPAPQETNPVPPDTPAAPPANVTPDPAREPALPLQPVAQGTPSAQRLKAALAFSGAGEGDVDPVSVAAFQSFMRPGDAVARGDPLRDGVSALLAQVPCSRLQVAFDPDTATLQVKGHVPEDGLRAPVLAALQQQMGADIAVSDDILILPRPQCGALAGIGDVGLPQSTDQITNPLLIGDDTHARVLDFVQGQRLWFDLTAPDYAAYVYVDYFDAGGNVLHLSPNDQVPLQSAPPDTALRVGARSDDDSGLQIYIGPPYGQEIAVAFAASHPLYDGLRPMVEPAAPYLEWLKARVDEARGKHPDFKGEWVYFFVSTSEG